MPVKDLKAQKKAVVKKLKDAIEKDKERKLKGNKEIDAFLEEWKARAIKTYYNILKNYLAFAKENNFDEKHGSDRYALRVKYFKYLGYDAQAMCETLEHKSDKERAACISRSLDYDKRAKKISLITRVEDKAGVIVSTSDLRIGLDGNLNGKVIGKKATVRVQTIYAGGYNIQILHYRVLVK